MGKTTLMRAISSKDIDVNKNIRVLHVEQEAHGDDTKAIDCVLNADVERLELLELEKQLGESGDVDRMEKVYERLQEIESDQAVVRAGKILHGLGFDSKMQQMKTSEFSGGWRMRLALARALFCEYDVLLLDEPTNCLDYQSKLWLQHYLMEYHDKCLLVVSHDRGFLNSGVVQHIVHLHDQKLTMYKGDYDQFEDTRNELLRQQAKAHAAQEAYTSHIKEFIDKFRFNAKRAPLVQSRIKALAKLKPVNAVVDDPDFVFSFPKCDDLFGAIVEFRNVTFCYPGESVPIFKNLNLTFSEDSRICMTGKNGQGKSTILKLLLGDLEPQEGEILVNPRLKIGRFSQHHVDLLEYGMTGVDFLRKHYPGGTEQEYRAHLGRYGLSGDLGMNEISTLSGGQKSRLVFAWMSYTNPHFLVLDEPENHLDVDTVDALAVALNDFNGAAVIVSHDERLVSLCANEMWIVDSGTVKPWAKDWEAYKKVLIKELAF
jgi:ATP-binding cassette subfamily F protein 3